MPAICLKNIKKKHQLREFEFSPIALFIVDLSAAKELANEIKQTKNDLDYYSYIRNDPASFKSMSNQIEVLDANNAAIKLYEATNKNEAKICLKTFFTSSNLYALQAMFISFLENKKEPVQFITSGKTFKKNTIEFIVRITPTYHNSDYKNTVISFENIETIKNLTTERNIFYKTLESTAAGLSISDENGNLIYFNPAVEKIYGYEFLKVKGAKNFFVQKINEAYQKLGFKDKKYENFTEIFKNSTTNKDFNFWKGDLPAITEYDTVVWVSLTVNTIRSSNGKITNYIISHDDISYRMQRETEIRIECYNALTELAEMRDNETGKHLTRVSLYSTILAFELGLDKNFCNNIKTFAPLHDVGKVGISDEILLAPRKLTTEEFNIMKKHTEIGYNILKNRRTLEMAADIAYCHHEKYDGTGYPKGLKEKEIPYAARIVAIADVYDALRSKRPYKEPWEHNKVFNTITTASGSHFDPQIVEAFKKHSEEFKKISIDFAD